MADYNIYIHTDQTSDGLANKTKPFQNREIQDTKFGAKVNEAFNAARNTTSTIANGQVVNTGVSALSKVFPTVAIAVATTGITNKIISTGFAHQQEYTGNYKNSVNYNNFKATINMILNPIGTALNLAHKQAQIEKANIQINEQNKLLGDSILKNFNIGV